MQHADFVEKYRSNEIMVHIDESAAGYLYGEPYLMPKSYRLKQANIRALFYLGTLVSIVLFFYIHKGIAFLLLICSLYMSRVAQNNAADGVLEAALVYPAVYNAAVESNVLTTSVIE